MSAVPPLLLLAVLLLPQSLQPLSGAFALARRRSEQVATGQQPRLYPRPDYEAPDYWPREAQADMERASRLLTQLRYSAKNVILFIGDGMGVSTVTAGRILKGQLANSSGEEAALSFDQFDHAGLIRTYNADRQTSDSASTATAFLCGQKTNYYTLGVNQKARLGSCSTYNSREHDLTSFFKFASDQGRSTGLITTQEITAATPAPAYASVVNRNWQDDTDRDTDNSGPDTLEQRRACPDIATQLVDRGINFTVLMGGGRLKLLPNNVTTVDHVDNETVTGTRSDGVNLVERWRRLQAQFGRRAGYVETTDELESLDANSVDSLLALMATKKMQYHIHNINSQGYREPSLADMTRKTLQMLAKNTKGYTLLVEGARIDNGHHGNRAQRALYDVIAFDEAVEVAVNMTNREETLIVVSADHSHVFTIGHYGYRGQPILDKVVSRDSNGQLVYDVAPDNIQHTVANYANGPSAREGKKRRNISSDEPESDPKYRYPSLVPRSSETHSAEDVAVYARGPGAHLFQSVHQQSYIAHVIMKAACLGWYAETGNCLSEPRTTPEPDVLTVTKRAASNYRLSAFNSLTVTFALTVTRLFV